MSRKVFVSHCYQNRQYADIFVKLLKDFGFREEDIFYSSNPETGVNAGELIYDRLKRELEEHPVVLYFLSDDYYQSVTCLNEMGASWIMATDQFPITLPEFPVQEIRGSIRSDRSALVLSCPLSEKNMLHFMNQLCKAASITIPSEVDGNKIDYIRPALEKIQRLILEEQYLFPNEDGLFETTLREERLIKSKKRDKFACFKLAKPIAADCIGLSEVSRNDQQFLFFSKSWGDFQEGQTVQFKLNKESPYFDQKKFIDIGKCKNIYVSYIEKKE